MKTYELSVQKNIRDLGGLVGYNGKTIKFNRLFRGGAFPKVDEEDIKILESFHLTDVVDFRGNEEFTYKPDYVLKGVKYHNFPAIEEKIKKEDRNNEDGNLLWFVGDHQSGYEHLKEQYRRLVTNKKGIKAYKDFFRLVQEDNHVIYFHCSQGKDRAGLASFFIEMALGVSMEQAIDDYLLTNIAMEKRTEALLRSVEYKPFYNEEYKQSLLDVFSAKLDYLNETINEINKQYGNIDNFLVNVLDINLEKMRELYLE